jgi:hypothetical protein
MTTADKLNTLTATLAEGHRILDEMEVTHAIDMALLSHGIHHVVPGRIVVRHVMDKHPDWSVLDCVGWVKCNYPRLFHN